MSLQSKTNQVIALSAISQACFLVHQLATKGTANNDMIETCIHSLLKIDSDSVLDIYGGLTPLKKGIEQFELNLSNNIQKNTEQIRYAMLLIALERNLSKHPQQLKIIQTNLTKAQTQAEIFGTTHSNVLANLGDTYHSNISPLKPRIMVKGKQQYLRQADNVNKIRALLLAGIRAALLWRQCGGIHWKLPFIRSALQQEAQYLLETLNE